MTSEQRQKLEQALRDYEAVNRAYMNAVVWSAIGQELKARNELAKAAYVVAYQEANPDHIVMWS